MSHIVTIRTLVRDQAALVAACHRLGLGEPRLGTAALFSSQASGQIVDLPGWTYPVVVNTVSGEIRYDNYNGAWGPQQELDRLLQAYAVEKTKLEARRLGHAVVEQPLADGSIKVTLKVGGRS